MSKRRPWFSFYVADYFRDTFDLRSDESGVYLTLLGVAWEREDCALPNDMKWMQRALAAHLSDMHGNRFNRVVPPLLERFFELGEDGKFRNKRLTKEREKSENLSGKQRENVEKRWAQTRENKDLADTAVIPARAFLQSQSQSHKEGPPPPSGDGPPTQGFAEPVEEKRPSRMEPVDGFQLPTSYVRRAADADVTVDDLARWFDGWKLEAIERCLVAGDWDAVWAGEFERRLADRKPKAKPRVVLSKGDPPPKRPKTLLPDTWRANPRDRAFAQEHGFDPDAVESHFRDVWTAGQYKHADHDATFRNFIRSEASKGRQHHGKATAHLPAQGRRGGSLLDAADRFEAELDRRIAAAEADERRLGALEADYADGQAAVLILPPK